MKAIPIPTRQIDIKNMTELKIPLLRIEFTFTNTKKISITWIPYFLNMHCH